jgi:hypothetical protein
MKSHLPLSSHGHSLRVLGKSADAQENREHRVQSQEIYGAAFTRASEFI